MVCNVAGIAVTFVTLFAVGTLWFGTFLVSSMGPTGGSRDVLLVSLALFACGGTVAAALFLLAHRIQRRNAPLQGVRQE